MTAPYTFVDFRKPLPGSALGADTEAVFDRPVPGRYTGRIDLTITTLSPLFIGAADRASGQPVMIAGVPVIPGSALKGMVRAYLAAMTGTALGPQSDTPIWYRNPVATRDSVVATILRERYVQARGATAEPGRQRIGLLVRDPVAGYAVIECPQLRLPLPGRRKHYSKVPTVTWRILSHDLGIRRHLTDTELARRNDRRLFVVWAAVTTTSRTRKTTTISTRKVVFAVGDTAEAAAANARDRRDRERAYESVPASCFGAEYVSFLNDVGLYGRDPDEPEPAPMILHATGLTAPDDTVQAEANDAERNAYLFPCPGSTTAAWIAGEGDGIHQDCGRIPVADATVVADLTDPAHGQVTDYQQQLPSIESLLGGDGVPVFFDVTTSDDHETVVRLGRGGGFRIRARKTFLDTIAPEYREAGFDPAAPDLVQSLFGDSDDDNAKKGRLSFGTATTDNARLLSRQADLILLGPKIQAWYRYLRQVSNPTTDDPRTYDHDDAAFRGRKMYLHRWHREKGKNDEQTWQEIARRHRNPDTAVNGVGSTITPVAPRTRFTGSIRFTNLTSAELGALILVLSLGNDLSRNHGPDENPYYAHLLGGGRPLGLGSVHLAPAVYLDHPDRYSENAWDATWHKLRPQELTGFVEEFRTVLRHADTDQSRWSTGPDAKRWPDTIAQVLTVAQWRKRLPAAATADSRTDHELRRIPKPLSELSASFGKPDRKPAS